MKSTTIFRTMLTVSLFLLTMSLANAKIYLVSVGVANYPNLNKLTLPVKDARAVKYVYDQNGQTESVLLADEQATRDNILSTMRNLFSKASESDIVVLFFSGHGYQGGFCAYDGRLSYASIRKALASSRSKNKMIFADACFSGDMRQARNSGEPSRAAKRLNVMLFLSSRSDETSLESPSMANGYFTDALQKALRGGADTNRDRTVTARELYLYVSKTVQQATNQRQHPVMWGQFSNNMPVLRW